MQAKICVVSKAMVIIVVMLWTCPVQASTDLPLFLRLAKEALFIPAAMVDKFADDPVVLGYQQHYEQAKLKPNLGSVPPRPNVTPKPDMGDAQKKLQQQRDQLWQAGQTGSEREEALAFGGKTSSNLAGNSHSESDNDENGAEKHAAWVPNLLGKRAVNTTNSSESGWSNYAPFGMAIAKPSSPFVPTSPFYNSQFASEDMVKGDFLPTLAPTANAVNSDAAPLLPSKPTDRANTEQPKVPALEKRLENLVPDAGFLAAVPPRSAKIAPPKANQQSQTAKTADKENALKLAILVFAEGAETIPENAQTVLQKVAAYQKQQQIRVSLRVDRGEKQPLATARLAAIREQLVAYGVPAEMIRLDEQSSSKAAKPLKIPRNQIIIFGEPVTKSQKAG